MIKKGRHLIKNYMTLEYDFSGIRLQESALTPVDWKLSVDLVALEKKNKKVEDQEYQAGLTYQKIYFWLETNMPNIIVVDVGNKDDFFIANLSSNLVMHCPGNPGDDLLIQLIHSKISALSIPDLTVGEMRLKGSDTSLQYTFGGNEEESSLPLKTDEYYTAGKPRHATPWWNRKDGFCFEFAVHPDPEVNEKFSQDIVDPLDEFQKILQNSPEPQFGTIKEPAKIIQLEKWKPRRLE